MSTGLVNPEIISKGGAIANALMEGGAAGWSTLIGKNVTYSMAGSDYGRADEVVKASDMAEAVVTPVDWSGDASGKVYLLMPASGAREIVAYMMALMLGGDPNPDATKLDADGMDAYSEAANSYFGQGIQQARSEIGGSIKTSVGTSSLADFSRSKPEASLGRDDYYCSKVKVTIEGRPPFVMEILISRSVTGVEAADEPAPGEAGETADRLGVDAGNLAIAMKIKLPIVVYIASKKMRMELIQDVCPGTIIEFKKKMSGENLDVMAGKVKIAMAEAVIVNQYFGVQIRSIVDPRAVVKD